MLCPDVWNLPEPKYNHTIIRGHKDEFQKKISSGNFSEYITLVIPGNFPHPESVENVLLGSDSYIVRQLPVGELLVPEFLEAFVKKGQLYGLSLSQETESECCIAVTPNGVLSIGLNRDAFESIQLTGKPIQTSRKFKDRYLCEINLKDGALLKDTAYRKMILNSLSKDLIPRMDIKISWTPPSTRFCPSSVAKFFSDRNFSVELCPTKMIAKEVFPGNIPQMIVAEEGETKEDFEERVVDFLEFVGLLALNCSTSADEYLCSYNFSGPLIETEKVTVLKWKGFFTKHLLKRIYHWMLIYLKRFPTIPWIVINVERTSHTPFADAFTDRTFSITNDSSYALILSPKEEFIWHQIIPIDKRF